MKTVIILSLLCLPLWGYGQQDSSGIYKTFEDYKNKKPHLAIDCGTQNHKIKSDEYHHKDYVRVIHNDSLFTMRKDQIFGYRDCNGVTVRIVDGKNYSVLNPYEYIQLYKHEIRGYKRSAIHYYYSKGIDGVPIFLSKENLSHSFQENPAFLKKINETFKRDGQLTRIDKQTKRYLINQLFTGTP